MSRTDTRPASQAGTPRETLSFCEPTVTGIGRWVESLPRANLGEYARQLYQALTELNQLASMPSGNRLAILEILAPELQWVCHNLELRHLGHQITPDAQAQKVINLCQTLQIRLLTGYRQVAAQAGQLHASPEIQRTQATALQRMQKALQNVIVRAMKRYQAPPKGVWQESLQTYAMACRLGVDKMPVAENPGYASIQQIYLGILLLGTARCNQLRPEHIELLQEAIPVWSGLAVLQPGNEGTPQFLAIPGQDVPPSHAERLPRQQRSLEMVGLDTRLLTRQIDSHLKAPGAADTQLEVPRGMSADLLRHLGSAWSAMAQRNAPRTPGSGALRACLGMNAVHEQLSKQRPVARIRKKLHHTGLHIDNRPDDIWKGIFGNRDPGPPAQTSAQAPSETPIHELEIINQSLTGYCLRCSAHLHSDNLRVGEVLLLAGPVDPGWQLASICWIRQTSAEEIHMGCCILSRQPRACALQILSKDRDMRPADYRQAILLPEAAAEGTPPAILVPMLPFKSGQKVLLVDGQHESRAQLQERHTQTARYNVFEYQLLSTSLKERLSSGPTVEQTGDDDFDSLWKSL